MGPLRVALLATSVDFGGIERVLLTLIENLPSGIQVFPIVFTRTDARDRTFFDRLTALGIDHEILYVNTSRLTYANPVRNAQETLAILRARQFDLVHSHGYRADMLGVVVSKHLRLPLVTTCHGFISNDYRLRLYNRLNVFILRYFSRVIAVSAPMKSDLVARGVSPAKIIVIENAVERVRESDLARRREQVRAQLEIGPEEFVFGYVGRLSVEKGVKYLIEAAQDLRPAARNCRVLIVGDGPSRVELEAVVDRLGLRPQVTFVGFQRDPSRFYAAMDAFVLPSVTEGTPMALLEAMAHRLPVIATAVGGVPMVLSDRANGLLVPSADPGRLCIAMRAILTDADLRRIVSHGALETIRKSYDVGRWVGRVRQAYLSALPKPRPEPGRSPRSEGVRVV